MTPGAEEPAIDGQGPAADDNAGGAPISLMITRRQRAALRALGVSDETVATMTPCEAHELLRRRGHPDAGL